MVLFPDIRGEVSRWMVGPYNQRSLGHRRAVVRRGGQSLLHWPPSRGVAWTRPLNCGPRRQRSLWCRHHIYAADVRRRGGQELRFSRTLLLLFGIEELLGEYWFLLDTTGLQLFRRVETYWVPSAMAGLNYFNNEKTRSLWYIVDHG
jgi:hypothetical protein